MENIAKLQIERGKYYKKWLSCISIEMADITKIVDMASKQMETVTKAIE